MNPVNPSSNDELSPTSGQHAVVARGPAPIGQRPTVEPFVLRELGGPRGKPAVQGNPNARQVLRIVLGRARIDAKAAGGLRGGSIVALDQASGQSVEVFVGETLVARGELVVVDGKFCVQVTHGCSESKAA